MLWTKNYRRELISKGIDGASVSKILADEWKKLTEDEKSKYSDDRPTVVAAVAANTRQKWPPLLIRTCLMLLKK